MPGRFDLFLPTLPQGRGSPPGPNFTPIVCTGLRPAPSLGLATRCEQACRVVPYLLQGASSMGSSDCRTFGHRSLLIWDTAPYLFGSLAAPFPQRRGDGGCALQGCPRHDRLPLHMECLLSYASLLYGLYMACVWLYMGCMRCMCSV